MNRVGKPGWWRGVWRMARALAIAYLLVLLFLMWFEESLIFFPSRHPIGDWEPLAATVEDAWFDSADGTKLHGWYLQHERPRAVVLFAHGNAGNLTHRLGHMLRIHEMGASLLAFDYRGYGRSKGKPTGVGIVADARAARQWLARRAGVEEHQVVLAGESLGGGVMVQLAAADGARGLVLENTFTSLDAMASVHYPWVPARWVMRTRLDSLSRIGDYRGPLLICHGDADSIVPYQHGQRLFETANEPKRFVRLAGHDHNDPLPEKYYQALDQFLGRL